MWGSGTKPAIVPQCACICHRRMCENSLVWADLLKPLFKMYEKCLFAADAFSLTWEAQVTQVSIEARVSSMPSMYPHVLSIHPCSWGTTSWDHKPPKRGSRYGICLRGSPLSDVIPCRRNYQSPAPVTLGRPAGWSSGCRAALEIQGTAPGPSDCTL